jgi:hypothetical protein
MTQPWGKSTAALAFLTQHLDKGRVMLLRLDLGEDLRRRASAAWGVRAWLVVAVSDLPSRLGAWGIRPSDPGTGSGQSRPTPLLVIDEASTMLGPDRGSEHSRRHGKPHTAWVTSSQDTISYGSILSDSLGDDRVRLRRETSRIGRPGPDFR